jgi:hypothetical protein
MAQVFEHRSSGRAIVYEGIRSVKAAALWRFPDTQQSANHDQLADVVRGVVGDEEQFSKIGLTRAMRNPRGV